MNQQQLKGAVGESNMYVSIREIMHVLIKLSFQTRNTTHSVQCTVTQVLVARGLQFGGAGELVKHKRETWEEIGDFIIVPTELKCD